MSLNCQKFFFLMFKRKKKTLSSFSFILQITSWTDLHLRELERILPASPGGPLNAIRIRGVLTAQVLAVQVWCVTVAVPPGTVVEWGTIVLRVIIIPVFCGELHPIVFQQRVTCRVRKDEMCQHVYICIKWGIGMVYDFLCWLRRNETHSNTKLK